MLPAVNATRVLLTALSMALAGCGSPRTGVPNTPSAPLVPTHPSGRIPPAECRIEATRAEALIVGPEDGEPFTVAVTDGLLTLSPTADGRLLHASVEHPLRFEATAPLDDQLLVLSKDAELAAGSVRAPAGTRVVALAQTERGLAGSLAFGRSFDRAHPTLVVGPLRLDCEALTIADSPTPTAVHPRAISGAEVRVASALPLVLRPVRAAPTTVQVRPREQDGFIPVWMTDRQGDDARVTIALSNGALISGWAELATLREPSAEEAEVLHRALSAESVRLDVNLVDELPAPEPPAQGDGRVVGRASLRASSPIRPHPEGAPWARSSAAPLDVQIRWTRGAEHAELLEIPGMWLPRGRSWVERDALVFP